MSESEEAATTAGRLADLFEDGKLWLETTFDSIDESYTLSEHDKKVVIDALRITEALQLTRDALALRLRNLTTTPIPTGVYFRNANFYNSETRVGMGIDFFERWKHRAWEFPGAPQTGRE